MQCDDCFPFNFEEIPKNAQGRLDELLKGNEVWYRLTVETDIYGDHRIAQMIEKVANRLSSFAKKILTPLREQIQASTRSQPS